MILIDKYGYTHKLIVVADLIEINSIELKPSIGFPFELLMMMWPWKTMITDHNGMC